MARVGDAEALGTWRGWDDKSGSLVLSAAGTEAKVLHHPPSSPSVMPTKNRYWVTLATAAWSLRSSAAGNPKKVPAPEIQQREPPFCSAIHQKFHLVFRAPRYLPIRHNIPLPKERSICSLLSSLSRHTLHPPAQSFLSTLHFTFHCTPSLLNHTRALSQIHCLV